jgi:GR25 family glycosyltransferase involved in LPS biosynthesis
MSSYQVYCFSYKNELRYKEIKERFTTLDIDTHWIDAVGPEDSRIFEANPKRGNPNADGCMYSHLRSIETFLKSDKEFGIFCEDDIYIRKSFKKDIHVAIDAMKRLDLHVILLGYLLNYIPVENKVNYHNVVETPFTFLNVFKETWGTQMYMLNRAGAEECLRLFSTVKETEEYPWWAADWTITKLPKGACMYPMLAVEKVYTITDDNNCRFHLKNQELNYNPEFYI